MNDDDHPGYWCEACGICLGQCDDDRLCRACADTAPTTLFDQELHTNAVPLADALAQMLARLRRHTPSDDWNVYQHLERSRTR